MDVECVFGIFKAWWGILDKGFMHRRIHIRQKLFVACCVLHNMMLDEMKREETPPRIGQGCRMPHNKMWLKGPTVAKFIGGNSNKQEKAWSIDFHWQRNLLGDHIQVWKNKC